MKAMQNEMRDRIAEIIRFAHSTANPLGQYGYAEADALIANGAILLPCKVGDAVYYFSHRPFNRSVLSNTIYEAHIVRMAITRFGIELVLSIRNEGGVTEVAQISSFGKTVFLSREEAEKSLEEMKNNETTH